MIKLLNQTTYDRESIKHTLSPVLHEMGLFERLLKGRTKVLLKPNFVVPADRNDASTTHPDFYMAVVELLLDQGFTVGIGESPAFGSCTKALAKHGVADECRARGVAIVEFTANESYIGVADEKHYRELSIACELRDWDAVINLPKLKTHQQFTFTAATKNLYGCVSGKRKFVRHNLCRNDPVRFAKMILANAAKAACVLHIGDGVQAMHITGPRGGAAYPLGKIIVADDFLTHDWLFCRLIGLDPLATPLFQAVPKETRERVRAKCRSIVGATDFQAADDFIHAYLTDISFSPWHIVRSGWRTFKHNLNLSAPQF